MAKRKPTLREYVNSFDRQIPQYKIADVLGIAHNRFSMLMRGDKPRKSEIEKLRAKGIEVAA